jgi:hypothetical protein
VTAKGDYDDEFEGWRAAFSDHYIDPYNCVNDLVEALRQYITEFCTRPSHYIAPYTCIVTSSMMGKSRLMKEVATRVPTVYMCLGTNRTFYPHPTKVVVEWIRGGLERMGYWHPSDKEFLFPTLKYSAFLLALILQLPVLVRRHNVEGNYSWMWKFFAEPPNDCEEINYFWTQVTDEATAILRANSFSNDESQKPPTTKKRTRAQTASTRHKSSAPQKPSPPFIAQTPSTPQTASSPQNDKDKKYTVSAGSARKYLAEKFGADLRSAYSELKKAFNGIADEDFDMLFIFDEARCLTDTSAIDGKLIPVGAEYPEDPDSESERKASE